MPTQTQPNTNSRTSAHGRQIVRVPADDGGYIAPHMAGDVHIVGLAALPPAEFAEWLKKWHTPANQTPARTAQDGPG